MSITQSYHKDIPDTTSATKIFIITRINNSPKIDAKLADEAWQKVKPISDFVQYDPNNGQAPTETTYVYVCYDADNIYFAFDCRDSEPDKIVADITPRNEFRNNDAVGIILDTFNDRRNAFWFTVNPYGIQRSSFDTIWESAGRITSTGWIVEIAIPFKSLRFSRDREQIWGINFWRSIQRKNETSYWTWVGRDDNLLEKNGFLKGLKDLHRGHNIEFFPYGAARNSKEIGGTRESKSAVGLDFKYGMASNLTLDASISPDFSEVESDPFFFQLTPYEYYLRERRPFFEEGSRYFRTPIQLFYSRRIKNPKLALKITGKTGDYTIGGIAAADKVKGKTDEYYGILRLKRDILKTSDIGIMLTDKEWQNGYNRSIGLDGRFRFGGIYSIRWQIAQTYGNSISSQNTAYYLNFWRWVDNGITCWLYLRNLDKNFQPKTGFVPRTDVQSVYADIGYAWRINKKGIRRLRVELGPGGSRNHAGLITSESISFNGNIEFTNNFWSGFGYSRGRHRSQVLREGEFVWDDDFLRSEYFRIFIGSFRGGFIDGRLWFSQGVTSVYQDNYTRVVPGISRSTDITLILKPRKNIEINTEAEFYGQYLKESGKKVFGAWTISNTIKYQFTKDLFARTVWLAETERNRHRLDFLLGYYFRAGSIFYLTYKDQRQKSGARTNYTFLAKFSYLWRI